MNEPLPSPPPSPVHEVVDDLHGERIIDRFRWLEDADSAETRDWVEAQNHYTRQALDSLPGRERIAARLRELLAIGTISPPEVRGNRSFFERRDGEQNQPILYLRTAEGSGDRVVIDLNAANPEGTTALDWWEPSRDGRLLAYGLSEGGDERSTLYVRDVDTGVDLSDRIPNTRAASLDWLVDGSGFYYTRYPTAGEVPAGEEMYHRRVYLHRLGTDAAGDPLVFGADRDATDWPSVELSSDGRHLLIVVSKGWDRSDCYLREEGLSPGPFRTVIAGESALSTAFLAGGRLYLLTNLDAPNYRLFAIDPARLERGAWQEIVPEREDAILQHAHVAGETLLIVYLKRACSRLEARRLDGASLHEVALPAVGSIDGLTGEPESDDAFVAFSSYTTPPIVLRYNATDRALSEWARIDANVSLDGYTVDQVDYPSHDGTRISMFLVGRAGLARDGSNSMVLSGYGGFNISMTPAFSRSLLFWLERGGLYAVPNLRGGGEYGEAWHRGGMLGNKQHVFDDFIAAADYLCHAGYTSPSRLAISGGSNGGLLVGAAITQRPDLFRAAICAVPLLDMLRYHRFQIARLWVAEYGSADDPEQFAWLRAYSPYHHVQDGAAYPAVLLLSGEQDSRVDPLHARKMAARLQEASSSGLPVLLRTEPAAGHGAGRPLAKTLTEQTDVWSFLCWQLGVPV